MIDTHLHLTFPDYTPPQMPGGIPAVLQRAQDAGVTACISISTTTRDCVDALNLAHTYPSIYCTAGVHPLYSSEEAAGGPHDWDRMTSVARDPKCVAWGELGLDQHYQSPDQPTQLAVLHHQLQLIASLRTADDPIDLPIVIHCRKAFDDLIPILEKSGLPPHRFVFHCFTGDLRDMDLLLTFGACVSFTGVLTYKNAPEVREAAKLALTTAPNRIMVETDAPFLSPEPVRGLRPNEPAAVVHIAHKLAELADLPFDELHALINANTHRFFNIPTT